MGLVVTLLVLYTYAVIVRIILEWFPVPSDHPVGQVRRFLASIVDPALVPLRRIVPPLPIGHQRLDLSPIVLIIGLQLVIGILS